MSSPSGRSRSRFAERQRGDVRHTGADDGRAARDELGFRRADAASRTACAPSSSGCAASRSRARRRSASDARRRRAPVWRGSPAPRLARAAERPPQRAPPGSSSTRTRSSGSGTCAARSRSPARLGELGRGASSLILSGSPIAPFFALPAGRRHREAAEPHPRRATAARRAGRSASISSDLRALRSSIARAAAESFAPDVVVVDKVPLGLDGELAPAAARRSRADPRRRLVLGLRDIDDSPERVRRKWSPTLREAIESHFDAVLVYGPESSPDALALPRLGRPRRPGPPRRLPRPAHAAREGPDDLAGRLRAGHRGRRASTASSSSPASPARCASDPLPCPGRDRPRAR